SGSPPAAPIDCFHPTERQRLLLPNRAIGERVHRNRGPDLARVVLYGQSTHYVRELPVLLAVGRGQRSQHVVPSRRDSDVHAPVVDGRGLPPGETALHDAVNQPDGGVMLDLECLGELTDRGWLIANMTPDRNQGLVLLRRQTSIPSSLLAEPDELPQRRPKRGQRLEILIREWLLGCCAIRHGGPRRGRTCASKSS